MGAVRYGVASLTACDEWAFATKMVANAAPSMKTNASNAVRTEKRRRFGRGLAAFDGRYSHGSVEAP